MSHNMFIELKDGLLAYDDWVKAVDAVDGVRLFSPENVPQYKKPDLEHMPSWFEEEGTAEIQVGNEWLSAFSWCGGSVSFNMFTAEETFDKALALAEEMNAIVRGEEGEVYTKDGPIMPE